MFLNSRDRLDIYKVGMQPQVAKNLHFLGLNQDHEMASTQTQAYLWLLPNIYKFDLNLY